MNRSLPTAWEYKAVPVRSLVDLKGRKLNLFQPDPAMQQQLNGEVEASLNGLGGEGWELVLELNGALIFKRPQ